MSVQRKISEFSGKIESSELKKVGHVLDLEEKYFGILWELFTSDGFRNDLRLIEEDIQNHYDFLSTKWKLKNKIKVPAERLTRYYVYRNLTDIILSIYPSPVSGDIAFITDDAVINVDIKTLDTVGNAGDIEKLQFLSNQSSFENKNLDDDPLVPNSGVRVECSLPKEYTKNDGTILPVLTYFIIIVYCDNGESFRLCSNNDGFNTISLKCLPNGLTSFLFDNDIIENLKTYHYLGREDGFPPHYLTDYRWDRDDAVKRYAEEHSDEGYFLINGRSKIGVFNMFQLHPRYNANGVSWFPVRRKENNGTTGYSFYLEAVDCSDTLRVNNTTLENRYDSKDSPWEGIKYFDL